MVPKRSVDLQAELPGDLRQKCYNSGRFCRCLGCEPKEAIVVDNKAKMAKKQACTLSA